MGQYQGRGHAVCRSGVEGSYSRSLGESGIWQDETPCPSSSPSQQGGGGLAVAGTDHGCWRSSCMLVCRPQTVLLVQSASQGDHFCMLGTNRALALNPEGLLI